ncbi:MAG: sodium:solute symporter family transporter [Thermoguttaceae bacterium]
MGTALLLSVVVLLLAASVLVGLAAAWGKLNIADDYFLAGRQLPWYAVAVSLAAAGLGLESLLGMAGLAYKEGMAPAALCWGNFLAYSILLWVVVPYLVRKKLSSMGELLERRFARSTRAVYAAVMLAFMIFGVLAPALAAAGAAVCDAGLGRPPEGAAWLFIVAMVVVAAAAGVYSIYGGLAATSRAAMLQLLVVLAGGVLLVALGSRGLGGVEGVVKKNLAADPGRLGLLLPAASESLPWIGVLMFWFTLALGYAAGTQLSVQRCLGARSEWDAKMGVIGAGVLQVLLPAVLVLPGLVAYVRLGTHDISAATPDRTFLRLIQAVFSQEGVWGPLGRGLAVSAVVAAAMCVVGAVLNAASTLWSIDISQDMLLRTASEADMIRRGRWSSLAALVLGLAAAPLLLWWSQGLLVWIEETAAVAMPPLAVVLLAAFFWPRVHGRAATFTLVFGVVVGALLWAARSALLEPPAWFLAPLTRAAINATACVLALGAGTILIAPSAYEPYDPDTAWNLRWARLPAREQPGAVGNLVFWWAVMLVATLAVLVVFR